MNKEILEITKKFHDTYEKLASEYTYETREDTKVFDINSSNGKLMYATVNEVIKPILEENKKQKEVIFKIKMIISARIKEYQKKIDNEIDMGSQGDHFKICRYEENIKFLNDILKEVKTC